MVQNSSGVPTKTQFVLKYLLLLPSSELYQVLMSAQDQKRLNDIPLTTS